jgi:tetratricopeptide (TPR) repeat protein
MKLFLIYILCSGAICNLAAQSERSLVREGNRQYGDNKFSDAEVNYRKAIEKDKELREAPFNLGDALYKQGRFSEAAEQYQLSAGRSPDATTKAQSFYNLGNSLLKDKKYPESIGAYKEALKVNPGDEDTKYNLEYAKAMLKQQQQQQNKDQKKDDKQKQDQQKKDQQKQNDKKDQQKQDQQKQDQEKQDQQKQNQDKQQQDQQSKEDQKKAQQMKKLQISKQDAERILEALKNEEKQVQKKLHKKAPARVRVDKDW